MTEMPYLTRQECRTLELEPYAVYGDRVHSFISDGEIIPHGSMGYALALDQLKLIRLGVKDEAGKP